MTSSHLEHACTRTIMQLALIDSLPVSPDIQCPVYYDRVRRLRRARSSAQLSSTWGPSLTPQYGYQLGAVVFSAIRPPFKFASIAKEKDGHLFTRRMMIDVGPFKKVLQVYGTIGRGTNIHLSSLLGVMD